MAAISFNAASERVRPGTAQYRSRRFPRDVRCLCWQPDATDRGGGRTCSSATTPSYVFAVDKHPMIAVQLMNSDLSHHAPSHSTPAAERECARTESLLTDEPVKGTAQFGPLDPGIVSETIPAFFIGLNKDGFWVARDVNGQIGGIFLLENSAVSFARRNSRPPGCATIFPSERFELDLENKGNPLALQLASMIRLAKRAQQRLAALIGKNDGSSQPK
jgi:hypothetical protein